MGLKSFEELFNGILKASDFLLFKNSIFFIIEYVWNFPWGNLGFSWRNFHASCNHTCSPYHVLFVCVCVFVCLCSFRCCQIPLVFVVLGTGGNVVVVVAK